MLVVCLAFFPTPSISDRLLLTYKGAMHGKCRRRNKHLYGCGNEKVRTYDLGILSKADDAASSGDPSALFADRCLSMREVAAVLAEKWCGRELDLAITRSDMRKICEDASEDDLGCCIHRCTGGPIAVASGSTHCSSPLYREAFRCSFSQMILHACGRRF